MKGKHKGKRADGAAQSPDRGRKSITKKMTHRARRKVNRKREAAGKSKSQSASKGRSKRGQIRRPSHIIDQPRGNKAAKSLYDLLGGRDGVLDLIGDLPTSQPNTHLNLLRDILSNDVMTDKRADGVPKASFGMMLATSGVTEKEIYQLFLDRRRAETLVTLANAEPHLAAEVIHSASSKYVPCRECGGMKVIYLEVDGKEASKPCNQCDKYGMQVVEGSFKHQELFFDLTKLKQIPTTQISTNVDNRSVSFTVGQPGTAPTPLSMIKSLDRIKDEGARPVVMLNGSSVVPQTLPNKAPVLEAEVVVQHHQ